MEKIGQYTLVSEIGGGNFGKVYKVVDEQGQPFAMKKIQTRGMNEKLRSLIENEKIILQKINHSSVLKFIGFFENAHFVYIVTELCEGGDLENYIKNNGKVDYHIGRRWIRDLADAMKTLKNQNILHRDLKVANLLITDNDLNKAGIRICDFGFSKFLENSNTRTQLGTPLYMAPEILTSSAYNYKVDIWSLGVVVYEMLCGSPPFKCYNLQELKKQQKAEIRFDDNPTLPEPAKDFIRQLLTYNPDQRPDYSTILNHEFLKFEEEIKEEKIDIDLEQYDFCDNQSDKQGDIVEKVPQEIKSEDNSKDLSVESEEIIDENKEVVKEREEFKDENSLKESKRSEVKVEENVLGRQSIIVYLQKEEQSFAMAIEKEIEKLEIYERLTLEYAERPEIKYFLSEYRYKRGIEIIKKIDEARNHQFNVEEFGRLLDEAYCKLQEIGFELQNEIENAKKTYEFQEDYIRQKIIIEGYDLIENPNSLVKVNLLFDAAFYIYPGDELIFEFLTEHSS